jgi:hypothetical protein
LRCFWLFKWGEKRSALQDSLVFTESLSPHSLHDTLVSTAYYLSEFHGSLFFTRPPFAQILLTLLRRPKKIGKSCTTVQREMGGVFEICKPNFYSANKLALAPLFPSFLLIPHERAA